MFHVAAVMAKSRTPPVSSPAQLRQSPLFFTRTARGKIERETCASLTVLMSRTPLLSPRPSLVQVCSKTVVDVAAMMGAIFKTILAPPPFCYGLSEALLDGKAEA